MLWQRLLTAAVGIPVLLGLIWLGGWYFAGAAALLAAAGLREFYRLMAARERRAYPWLGYPVALLVMPVSLFVAPFRTALAQDLEPAILGAAFALTALWMLGSTPPWPRSRFVTTLAGHVYAAQLLSYLVRLRTVEGSPASLPGALAGLDTGVTWVVLVLAACWGMDTAAYAVGKTLGRHKLCPRVSPGKTVEGAIGALVGAVVVTAGLGVWCGLTVAHGAVLGAMLGVVGQAGDLVESMLKRRAGVKDSGAVLPGHGGVLDRFDSLLFSAPVAFFYLRAVLGT